MLKLVPQTKAILQRTKNFVANGLKALVYMLFILVPLWGAAQRIDTTNTLKDSLKALADTARNKTPDAPKITRTSGLIIDDVSGKPLPQIDVRYTGTTHGAGSDSLGNFELNAVGLFTKISFSYVGYQTITRTIQAGQQNNLTIRLKRSQTQLKEVVIRSVKKRPYHNKGNPAVELIEQVIAHKDQNRMLSTDYLQYDQYERIGFSVVNPPLLITQSSFFNKYKFMLDTAKDADGKHQISLPVYFSEKLYKNYYRKNPAKTIRILQADKETNILKFIDTAGVDIYLNRFYGNDIDLYANNIFILTNQFLSPIADHAPAFYKFFITDTIQSGANKLVEISFTPRAKGDLLFEGKLLITQDGRYAVESCELNVNKNININFIKDFKVTLDFTRYPDGRYYLKKSNVKANFGLIGKKALTVYGDRSVFYDNYVLNKPLADSLYQGKSLQKAPQANQFDNNYWAQHRADTLTADQSRVYSKMNRLQAMHSFKVTTWIASTLTGDYADVGPVQLGPVGDLYSFDKLEGSRFQVGGRTTPKFNKIIYLQGYAAYGTRNQQFKYNAATYIALNKTPFYRYPNNYFKISYLDDIGIPGQNFAINSATTPLSSFQTSQSNYFLYNKIFRVDYIRDFENHISVDLAFRNWGQRAAGALLFEQNDASNTIVNNLTTSEINLGIRYAPHEQFLQGTTYRRTIYSKYPIFNVQINHGIKGFMNASYNYTNMGASVKKRFYLSQLGFGDATLQGGYLAGKVPFPLLNISNANQSIGYDPDAYNQMRYLEFVTDHSISFNYTQSFNGFFLNKVPLVEHFKWREFLSFKVLYGGLRNENDPSYSQGLYKFPVAESGQSGTYALGHTPYIEAGAGLGNIFKLLRFDVIRRFNYLDHPNVKPYGIKFSINIDL